jgi:programmed cell death 6-interacting protein
VAERKKSSFELQAQLAKGIFDLYTQAYQLSNESLKKIVSEESRIFINNRRFYYVAISFIKMKDNTLEEFNKTGEGYGKSIAYLGLACDSLNQGYKDVKKIKSQSFDIQAYEDFKSSQEKLGQEMLDKNSRIYIQAVPDLGSLPKLDKKIMVSPQQIPDNLNAQLEGESSVLDALVPREVKGMIENYKRSMMEYVSENLNKYQNEAEIMNFLNNLDLPYSLETVLSQNEISESLWKNINEVQQKGGSMFLNNNITNLEKKGEEILRRINDMLQVLSNEEEEDKKYKSLYDARWNRTPYNQLNYQYINVLKEYQKKLEIAKNCDAQIKQGIMDHMKFFELLGLSKSSLSNKIPQKTDVNAIKNCEEAVSLRKDLDAMDSLKDKCMEVINRIFQSLNEDNMVPQFIKVLQKKSTEKQILADNKPKYDAMFKELETISEDIKILKLSITAKNEVFLRVKQNNFKSSEENEKFFRELEDYCKLYNQKLVNLQQGINFYTEFNRRLNDINGHITDFLVSRDIEKNDIIKHITSGGALNYNNVKTSSQTNQPQIQQIPDVSSNSTSNQFSANTNYWDFTNTNTNKSKNEI